MKAYVARIRQIESGRAEPTRPSTLHLLLRLLLLLAAFQVTHVLVAAVQGAAVEARVASVHGRVVLTGHARAASDLARGTVLLPGDEIDTRGGGRVSIELSDGSLVIVQPGSSVVLQDFRNVSSLRELLKITAGRVRVRINHFGGRPNPYRINSPTASIAVRGTEFSVSVEARGDTEVVVYEGLVEVASAAHPFRRVLVEPGHGVIVRPDDMRFFVPSPSNEIGERGRKHGRDDGSEAEVGSDAQEERSTDSLHTAAGVYERYFESIVESGETPLPSRFTAFPDSHFDSIDNPSYATEFTSTEGRFFLLPSSGGTRENERKSLLYGFGDPRDVDYSIAPQGTFFIPLSKYRAVLGGRMAFSRDGFQSFVLDENRRLTGPLFKTGATGSRASDGATTNRLFSYSLMAARRFGSDGRTSLGIGLDHLRTRGTLDNVITQTEGMGLTAREHVVSGSLVSRTRLTLGLTRELDGGHKLGLFYRYGFPSAEDRDRSRTLNDAPRQLNWASAKGRTSEIGLRLRGPLTRRLFYGAEGSLLSADNDKRTRDERILDWNARARSTRAALGLGLGYVVRPRTVLSFDAAGGFARISDARRENATGNLMRDERRRAYFLSLHAAVQTDVWRRLFVSGSVLSVTQSRVSDLAFYPNSSGQWMTSSGGFKPGGRVSDRFTDYFSNFGAGWRFSRSFLAEYIFSTDFGQTSPRHTLVLRYTFSPGGK